VARKEATACALIPVRAERKSKAKAIAGTIPRYGKMLYLFDRKMVVIGLGLLF